jgi:hypothetical protein
MHLPPISVLLSRAASVWLLVFTALFSAPGFAQQSPAKGSLDIPHKILDERGGSPSPAQAAGDPRFGDPIADPEGYAKRKEAYYAAKQDGNDTGEGRIWWNMDADTEPGPRTHDVTGKPLNAEQPGILYGSWELVKIQSEGPASPTTDPSSAAQTKESPLPMGMELILGHGPTGFSIPSLGFVSDWWIDESSTVIYLIPHCNQCQGTPPPVPLTLGDFPNSKILELIVPAMAGDDNLGSSVRLTFNKRN